MEKDAKHKKALYREHRPMHFSDVLGQEHIIRVLEGAIKDASIAHAYLFSGSRGTGKTSVARIFARGVGTSDKDVYEIDAASNRGIDDIRELRDAVSALPFESRYKVYIIDEVHMLTKEAFNALLKTLEEPPAHALFILATTEREKLPDTIISRCQDFAFKKPSNKILKELLQDVAKKENAVLTDDNANLIAQLSEGSFRDALGILQKVITAGDTTLDNVVGTPRNTLVQEFITAIDQKDAGRGLLALNKAIEENIDAKMFCMMVIKGLRAILLLRHAPDMVSLLKDEYSEEDFVFLKEQSKNSNSTITAQTLKELLSAYNDTGYTTIPALSLELALVTICKKTT